MILSVTLAPRSTEALKIPMLDERPIVRFLRKYCSLAIDVFFSQLSQPCLPFQKQLGHGINNRDGIEPILSVKIWQVTGLAETVGAKRTYPHALDAA